MPGAKYWQRQFVKKMTHLLLNGIVDKHFLELQKLQDESNPNFVSEVVSLYFRDSEELLNSLAIALHEQVVDFKQVDALVHQFNGSSSSVSAKRVMDACVQFRNVCEQNNLNGCLSCLQHIEHEYSLYKKWLQNVFKIEQKIIALGGTVPLWP